MFDLRGRASYNNNIMRVSVICTVLNEAGSIHHLLDSLVAQTRQPHEVLIVDGGSRDGTQAVVKAYADRLPIQLHEAGGANISQGRNVAVACASGDVIASVDAGVWLEPVWLERIVSPFENAAQAGLDPGRLAVAGFFMPAPENDFELALGATTLPLEEEIDPSSFLPSSRSVAFSREAFECTDGYPEWLDYCEDLVFDFQMIDCCGGFLWAPEAVAHFRPRPNLRSFFKQYYRYARGDGKADLWRKRHAIRYGTYLIAAPALILLSLFHNSLWLFGLLAGGLAYCWRPYQRLRAQWAALSWQRRLWTTWLIPVIRASGDVAKMLGYPVGLHWRWQNRHREDIHWRDQG
ncbi:MAG: glycosyltransferase [Chloroflexota bacterium]|nr:glycosyltransferase [Chloroflexota bacterium]